VSHQWKELIVIPHRAGCYRHGPASEESSPRDIERLIYSSPSN
jgi:hypothetical protein